MQNQINIEWIKNKIILKLFAWDSVSDKYYKDEYVERDQLYFKIIYCNRFSYVLYVFKKALKHVLVNGNAILMINIFTMIQAIRLIL